MQTQPQPEGANCRCPRCGQAFRCGAGDALACWCAGMRLGAPVLSALNDAYSGCLCSGCLQEIQDRQAGHAGP